MPEAGASQGLVVGVADMAIGREHDGRIVTYALGSCIGLSAWDPLAKVGALLHYMLPQPAEQADPKALKPFMYASTGIPLMLRRLVDAGAQQSRLVVCAAGGAEILEGASSLAIGRRNRTALRKLLWKLGVQLVAEATGGSFARTMTVDLARGNVHVRSRENEGLLWAPGMRATAPTGRP
jgi:chemotaxis protein CheD